jgi:hypothetical protein
MGMHMIATTTSREEVNATIDDYYLVMATQDIDIGDEILFISKFQLSNFLIVATTLYVMRQASRQ